MAFSTETVPAPAGTERIGAIACWGFGIVWAVWGLTCLPGGVPLATVALIVLTLAAYLVAIAFRAGESPAARWLPADWQRRYNLLVLAEFVAIFLTSVALGRTELISAAICLIVGLYFFPLASLFDMSTYRWKAIALCLVAAVGGVLFGLADGPTVRAVVGLGAAASLWATSWRVQRLPA